MTISRNAEDPTRVLILWADDRSSNLGVRALASGTAELARKAFPDAQVDFQSYGVGASPIPLTTRAILLSALAPRTRPLAKWIAEYDVIIDTGAGDSFADIYGLRRLLEMTAIRQLAIRTRTPYILGPQTIGPFNSRTGRLLGRWSLAKATVAVARDSASAVYAREVLHRDTPAATDVVFQLPAQAPTGDWDVLLNVSGLLWNPNPHVDHRQYRHTIRDLIQRLNDEGREVTLLTHVLESHSRDSDEAPIAELTRLFPTSSVLRPTGLEDARAMLSGAQLVIGARMHACLNALSQGIPAIAMAYSRKFQPLFDDLRWPHVVDVASPRAAEQVIDIQKDIAKDPLRSDQVQRRGRELSARSVTHIGPGGGK